MVQINSNILTYKVWIWIGSIIFVIYGCTPATLDSQDYIRWVKNPKHGLVESKQIGDLNFKIAYKPLDYSLLESNGFASLDSAKYLQLKEEIGGLIYFQFSIETLNGNESPLQFKSKSSVDFQSRVSYFSFDLPKDLALLIGNETFPCVLHHFERTYDMAPKIDMLVAFEMPEKFTNKPIDQELQFIYRDQIFGVGTIKIKIEKSAVRKTPLLIIL